MATRCRVEPDRGFAWVVLVSSFLNYMISTGVAITGCSIYLAAMIESYGRSRSEVYVVGALSSGIFFGSAPVASLLIEKAGLRTAAVVGALVASMGLVSSANVPTLVYHYVTFSVTAIGCGLMGHSSVVAPVHYFVKRRPLASSALYAAAGVSMMVCPNIVRLIIDAYSWRPSFYIMAAIVLNTCVLSMLIRPSSLISNDDTELRREINDERMREVGKCNSEVVCQSVLNFDEGDGQVASIGPGETFIDGCHTNKENEPRRDIRSERGETAQMYPGLVQNPLFWLLLLNCFLYQFAIMATAIMTPDMYAVGGMNDWQISVLFILWGSGNTLGRLLSGILWLKLASPLVVFCSANLAWASALLLYLGYGNFLCLVFANFSTSLGHGSYMTCFSMVAADLVGIRLANRALGFALLCCGVGGLVAPPILGKLYDVTTSYTWSLLLAAMMGFASFADVLMILCLRRRKEVCGTSSFPSH